MSVNERDDDDDDDDDDGRYHKHRGARTGPADPAAVGPIIYDKQEFLCSRHSQEIKLVHLVPPYVRF